MQPNVQPVMSVATLTAYIDREFPQIHYGGRVYQIEAVGPMSARLRMVFHHHLVRPGGTISGPSLFALADLALYVAILAHIGPVGLAVTTNMTMNFLRKPEPGDLLGECRLLKLGRRLAVGNVLITAENSDAVLVQATGTYSIPIAVS
jgi:uncharacterized protein (TIGR00369 family)